MMRHRSEFESEVEFEIEASKVHWSELEPKRDIVQVQHSQPGGMMRKIGSLLLLGRKFVNWVGVKRRLKKQRNELDSASDSEEEKCTETDWEVLANLREQWGDFFWRFDNNLIVGRKIAEGAQAEIFEASSKLSDQDQDYVVKVFKDGFSVRDLQSQWPPGMLKKIEGSYYFFIGAFSIFIHGGTLLNNGRFAFVMEKSWGDLRKLIDIRMQHNNNVSPPFSNQHVIYIMWNIAQGMQVLHENGITHRDLKASNVLINPFHKKEDGKVERPLEKFDLLCKDMEFSSAQSFVCMVADFECSVGVIGTGFWRAPEILLQLKHRRQAGSNLFTKEADVYSFAMTCYEVATGHVPFEGHPFYDYDIVLQGKRPQLPDYLDANVKSLMRRCWYSNPSKRPSFVEISKALYESR